MKAPGCGGQVAEVCYAKVQGQQACIDHFKNAKFPVLDLDCLPIEFRHMVRLQHLRCLQHFATLATTALSKLQDLYRRWLWQPSGALMPCDPRRGGAGVGGDGRGARLAAPAGSRLSTLARRSFLCCRCGSARPGGGRLAGGRQGSMERVMVLVL